MKPTLALLLVAAVSLHGRADEVNFNRDVRPILSEHCFACHGFDTKARKAKLRLDVPDGAFAARKGVIPIVPGHPDTSEVWARIQSTDPADVMPPPETNKKLTAAQKATLKAWIEQGAKYQKHWSFEPIVRSVVPKVAGAAHPIDAFLNARLAREGLTPGPEADRETLIRRVAFALTGLPPAVKDVDAYLADTAPGAYERVVDRYLASPQFGEEMARHWLDVARYADTHGLHLDNERSMWLYRDWVVQAFNQNLPFDQFTVWQVAGDLLPNPTPDQLVATGFSRCGVTTSEGGSINEEWLYRNAVERASTTAQAFLGLTAGCAVCHDHKFDPITAKEYYSFYAFFYSSADPALDGNISTTPPFFKKPSPEQKAALAAATKQETETLTRLRAAATKAKYVDPAVAKSPPGSEPVIDLIFDDTFPIGTGDRNTTRNAADWETDPPFGAKSGRRVLRQANSAFTQDIVTSQLIPVVMPASGRLEVWVRPDPVDVPLAIAVQVGGATKQYRWGETPPDLEYGREIGGTRLGPMPTPGAWTKLALTAEQLGMKPGQKVTSLSLQQYGGVVYWDAPAVAGEADPATDPRASFKVWWRSLGKKGPAELPADLQKIVAGGPNGKQPDADVAKLRTYYVAHILRASGEVAATRKAWEAARAARQAADTAIPGTFIFQDLNTPRDAFVMIRGQYDKKGEKVEPGVPAALPTLKPVGGRANRLDLARWLVSPEQPLTARVTANRLWQQFFGTGLVKTSFDFGSQGELPSHPELLDWLACELRDGESGAAGQPLGASHTKHAWDVKRFVRLLVTSAAFRRQSRFTPMLRQRDPENRLYARGPRFRLDAEQVRDNALFVSGLIDLTRGGRGVNTYQPPNIWEPVGYGDSNTRYYLMDHGRALYRRSIYVFLKRTAPPPFLTNFDGPNREQVCTVRDRTNTPLQALQLLNDVQHFEAARALAERALTEGGSTTEGRITFLYRTVLSRKPTADEMRVVTAALAKQQAIYTADPTAAAKAIEVGESKPRRVAPDAETAAWTMIANLILNLDETVCRN